MAIATRQQLHAMIDELSDDRLQDAREALGRLAAVDDDERLISRLRADGLLLSEPPALSDDEHCRLHDRPTVRMRGEPISETIVRDRRGVD